MTKKINIIEVSTKGGTLYSVGLPGGDLMDNARVERIVYEKHGYNKGRQGDFPAYIVFFEGTNIRKIVPTTEIKELAVEYTEEEAEREITPDLPE